MKALLVSGVSSRTKFIISNLERMDYEVTEWTFAKNQTAVDQVIPKDTEVVFVLTDFLSHAVAEKVLEDADKRGLKRFRVGHSWSHLYGMLAERGLAPERRKDDMIDQAPHALVVGGSLEDRPEIISRLINCGWKVKAHWLTNEGGHSYNEQMKGIKMVVVLRDRLDNKQYQQAHTLADLSRVPVVKWDIARDLFKHRLSQLNLLYQPLEVTPPVPALVSSPPVFEPVVEIPVSEYKNGPQKQTITYTSPVDSLITVSKQVFEELHTNPLFEGVTIQILEDGRASILPIARRHIITGEWTGQPITPPVVIPSKPASAPQPLVIEAPKPKEGAICQCTHTSNHHSGIAPFMCLLKINNAKCTCAGFIERPVHMPVVPDIEEPEVKPTVVKGTKAKGRGKGHLKGHKLLMDCRYPGCKTRSLGPRYGFMCKAHMDTPEDLKKKYQKAFNATHVNP